VPEKVLKFLPIVVGLFLGWLLANPPEWLSFLGPGRYLVAAALVFVILLAFTAFQILANLPEDVALEPLTNYALEGPLRDLVQRYFALGFVQAGPPLKVGMTPPALLVPLVHEERRTYGTAFQTGTVPAKTSFDFVSILEGDRGGLTSNSMPAGAALPAAPGSLRQVFRGAQPDEVFDGHLEALTYLSSRGLPARAVSTDTFPRDIKAGLRRQRKAFLAAPLRGTLIMLWRAATGQTPHIGSIRSQPAAQKEIGELLTGRRE